MKEMIYSKDNKIELLYNSIYEGVHYYIISYGTHPCAYIEIPRNHPYYGKDYLELDKIFSVHGGFTYAKDSLRLSNGVKLASSWFLGWDYAHLGDYMGFYEDSRIKNELLKKWTVEEIILECKKAIKELLEVSNGRL